jgi:hypothetical protein
LTLLGMSNDRIIMNDEQERALEEAIMYFASSLWSQRTDVRIQDPLNTMNYTDAFCICELQGLTYSS